MMRDTPSGLIHELREQAAADSEASGVPKELTAAWEAADYIEHLEQALAGVQALAKKAVDPWAWMTRARALKTPG